MSAKRLLRWILCAPLCLIFIAFDVVKLPVLILFAPLWLLLDIIEWTKGGEMLFLEFMRVAATMGWQMSKELLGERRL